jgi:uncharacterized membrane protein YfcA
MAPLPPDEAREEVASQEGEGAASRRERPEITQAPITATVIGLAAGAFSSLLGVGGGLLMVPAMVYLLRVRPHRAHGTSLAVILPTAMAGAYRYHEAHRVEWGLVLPLALGGVLGALIGAMLANALQARTLKRLFGLFVILTGGVMIVLPGSLSARAALFAGSSGGLLIGLVGLIAGALSGLLGVGGGIVMVPAIVFLLGRDQHVAQGVSLAVIIPVSISGAWIHARRGNVVPTLAFWLSVGGVIGATVVGHSVQRFSSDTLRTLFGAFLVISGVWMVGRRKSGR